MPEAPTLRQAQTVLWTVCVQAQPQVRVANCLCTSAAFTVGVEPVGFAVMCQLAATPSAFYAVSVRRLAHLHSGFLQTNPRGQALAVG